MGEDGRGDVDGIERWAADARAADAIDARVRERWLRTQAEESSTLAGVLVALAETATPVVVTTSTGRRHGGLVTMVGEDFFAVRRGEERVTLVAMAAVGSVEPPSSKGSLPIEGERQPSSSPVTLRDVLGHAVGDRPRLMLYAGDARTTGRLIAVGLDVVTVRTDADPPTLAYVSLGSVSEASLLDSG
ncbi:MAG: hypothetical protein M3159_09685 [Actinomycetota bacterium]|nr:hypothetical protein [Actinomycetota bacterium]